MTNGDSSSTGQLPRCLQPKIGQINSGSSGLHPDLLHGWQGLQHSSHALLPPRVCGAGTRSASSMAGIWTRHSNMGCRQPKGRPICCATHPLLFVFLSLVIFRSTGQLECRMFPSFGLSFSLCIFGRCNVQVRVWPSHCAAKADAQFLGDGSTLLFYTPTHGDLEKHMENSTEREKFTFAQLLWKSCKIFS